MLEIRNLTKSFQGPDGTIRALDGVSLTVAEAEFAAVQGPSGCGKTTLLLVAGGLLQPTGGELTVGGGNPYRLPPEKRSRFRAEKIGFVFQQFHLVPYLSVLENVLAAALARPRADAAVRARELIRRFNLEDRIRHTPGELSTGERQRTALARALLNRPTLLLADEPTGNLDRENADTVLRYFGDFAGEGGAVLLVTHDPRAAGYAHRTLQMEHGAIRPG
jgi:putative ABC transport system ATP-binding protein